MLLDTDIYCAQVLGEIIFVIFRVLAQIQNYFVVPNSTCWPATTCKRLGKVSIFANICKIVTMCHILTMYHYSNSCILYTWCPKQTMVMARCGQGWAGQHSVMQPNCSNFQQFFSSSFSARGRALYRALRARWRCSVRAGQWEAQPG